MQTQAQAQVQPSPAEMQAAAAACAPVCNPLADFSARFAHEGCDPAFPGCPLPPPCAPLPCGDELSGGTAPIGAGPGEAAIINSGFDLADKTRHRTINVVARWQFSPAAAEANPGLLTWQMPPGVRAQIEKAAAADGGGSADQAVLVGINVGRVRSTMPLSLAFVPKIKKANGQEITMPGAEVTDGGEQAAFAILAGTTVPENLQIVIHTASNDAYTASYQHFGADEASLREELLPKKSEDYTYVPVGHEIADTIVKNADRLKLKVTAMHVIDGALKVSNQLVDRVIGAILEVANGLPVVQLPTFSLTAVRCDGQSIGSPENLERLGPNKEVRTALREDTQVAEAKIQLVYMLVTDADGRRAAE